MTHSRPFTRPLRRDEASAYLYDTYGISRTPRTLAKYAVIGGGPRFRHAGRFPLYDISELDAWATGLMSGLKSSTSDVGEAA